AGGTGYRRHRPGPPLTRMPGPGRQPDLELAPAERLLVARLRAAAGPLPASGGLKPSVDLRAGLFPVGDQNPHPSCVAFAVTALCEFHHGRTRKLSERYLHRKVAEQDVNRAAGMRLAGAFSALREHGICSADLWPYDPTSWDRGDPGHPPAPANVEARHYRLRATQLAAPGDVLAIKRLLAGDAEHRGTPVAASLALLDGLQEDPAFHQGGWLRLPEEAREARSGHAMLLVGYRDDDDWPGGGFFIARNSWGEAWAAGNSIAPGHALIAYDYARACIYEATAGEAMPHREGATGDGGIAAAPPAGLHRASLRLEHEVRDETGSLLRAGSWALRIRGRIYRDTPGNRRAADLSGS
ncbi:MAG: C1 family peptidase, partial [Roseomonas sp.]|nr:C1 family peptidase [Roseomonas sp.]